MSHLAESLTALTRRTWVSLVAGDVVLFVLANVTSKNGDHPGTVSNLFFFASVVGAVLLLTLAMATVVRSRREASR